MFPQYTRGRTLPADEPASIRQVVRAVNNRPAGTVDLEWNFGGATPFPYVWLRDCCLCPDCFHPTTLSRSLRIDQLQVDIEPQDVQVRAVRGQGSAARRGGASYCGG